MARAQVLTRRSRKLGGFSIGHIPPGKVSALRATLRVNPFAIVKLWLLMTILHPDED